MSFIPSVLGQDNDVGCREFYISQFYDSRMIHVVWDVTLNLKQIILKNDSERIQIIVLSSIVKFLRKLKSLW